VVARITLNRLPRKDCLADGRSALNIRKNTFGKEPHRAFMAEKRRAGEPFHRSRVKEMIHMAMGNDNKLYVAGLNTRFLADFQKIFFALGKACVHGYNTAAAENEETV
jgi:hypothetical protein